VVVTSESEPAVANASGEGHHRIRTPAEGRGGRSDEDFVTIEAQRSQTAPALVVDTGAVRAGGELDHPIIMPGSVVWHDRSVRAVVQRVESAWVDSTVDGVTDRVGSIGPGLMVLLGVTHSDDERTAIKMAEKIWNLRVMDDEQGVMNRSIADTTRSVLVVSQFTLYGDTSAGRRPSWIAAARPEAAEPLVQRVVSELERLGASVATGRFRTDMKVALVNDGPVTVVIEL
jgi:D-tyrosyl-tRNA(Tyr) deacylase